MYSTYNLVTSNVPTRLLSEAEKGLGRNLPDYGASRLNPEMPIEDDFLDEYYMCSLLKKNPFLPIDVNRKEAAETAFWKSESIAKTFNISFEELLSRPNSKIFLELWKSRVHRILHRDPIFSFNKFTSGATVKTKKGNLPIERVIENTITPELHEYLSKSYLCESIRMARIPGRESWTLFPFNIDRMDIVPGSVLLFVEKTAFTDRIICKEAAVNSFVQRDIGVDMRNLLRQRTGIDLSTAQDKHKSLSRVQSISDHSWLTTDDLQMASDIPYIRLFEYLLPKKWYEWCNASRSHRVLVESSPIWNVPHYYRLEKFVTQGCGFTFELETILFYTLIESVYLKNKDTVRKPLVYGDDLIYHSDYVDDVRKHFRYFGFITNVEKSFDKGFFRESCGGDYYAGRNVRPVYFKVEGKSVPERIILANQLTERFGFRIQSYWMRKLYLSIVRSIPQHLRCWCPPHLSGGLRTDNHRLWRTFQLKSFTSGDGKDNRVFINLWQMKPVLKTEANFRYFENKAHRDDLSRLAAGGFMKSMGWNHETKNYNYVAWSGTSQRWKLTRCDFSSASSGVDETDPLSVFDILSDTKAPPRLYSNDYISACDSEKRVLLSRLFAVLHAMKEQVGTVELIQLPLMDL